jgi:cob(I)alamin adenosyltransferase
MIGFLAAQYQHDETNAFLQQLQSRLFTVGANLASDPAKEMITPDIEENDVQALELAIDSMNEELPTLKYFILPGGSKAVASAHLARTVCRRAERLCVALARETNVEPIIIRYLNRMSDYFFVLARWIGKQEGVEEIKWIPRVKKDVTEDQKK